MIDEDLLASSIDDKHLSIPLCRDLALGHNTCDHLRDLVRLVLMHIETDSLHDYGCELTSLCHSI